MKNALISIVLVLITMSCTQDHDPVPFMLDGAWEGKGWASYPVGADFPVITFSIKQREDHSITCSSGVWVKPDCMSDCVVDTWVVTSAVYSEGKLSIEWERGFSFDGSFQGGTIKGSLSYQAPTGKYVWKDDAVLVRK